MEDPTDPKTLVPYGAVVIAATYNAKTGDVKHSLLANDNLDPELLEQILRNASTMKITHKKFAAKVRLPPRRKGEPARSFRSRIIVRATAATSDLPRNVVRQLIPLVIGDFFKKMTDVANGYHPGDLAGGAA